MLITRNKPAALFILVILFVRHFCESKRFCRAFTQNDFKIDFGFGNKYTNLGQDVINLVIDDQFWVIENNYQDQKLSFHSTESATNDLFGRHYKMGFYMNFGRIALLAKHLDFQNASFGVRHSTQLWKAYNYAIDWVHWTTDGPDYNTFNRTDIWETLLFNPFESKQDNLSSTFAFHVRYIERKYNFSDIGFVEQQYDESNDSYNRKWNYWRLFTNGNISIKINLNLHNMIEVKNLQIIDISSSYLLSDGNDSKLDYVVLFLDKSSILYCYLKRGCTAENLQKLIDCKSVSGHLKGSKRPVTTSDTLVIFIRVIILSVTITALVLISWKLIEKYY